MAIEIERKFLVVGAAWRTAAEPVYYCQGYLNSDRHRTVRVRIAGGTAWLTVKGVSTGATRSEFEYEIPCEDARQLLAICEASLIEKHRRKILIDGLVWEVDEFFGENAGLVVAEVELDSEDQQITLPSWIGDEVTQDAKYFNSSLAKRPYCRWESL